MSDEASSSTNPPAETPVASGSRSTASTSAASASGSIGSLQTPTATPAGRLSSLRGGRGGLGAGSVSTRGGAAKMKFTPKVPTKRNKKDAAPSLLEEARAGSGAAQGPTRERGERGGARGRGRGRGRPVEVAATASGPFSLGPAVLARSRPIVTGGSTSGAHSSYTGAKAVKTEPGTSMSGSDRDYYGSSVDMKFGSVTTDASAPTGLEDFKSASFLANMKNWSMDEDDKKDGGGSTYEDADIYEDNEDLKPKQEGLADDLSPTDGDDRLFFFQFPSVMPAFKPRPIVQSQMTSIVSSLASSPTPTSSGMDGSEKAEYTEEGLLSVKTEPIDVERPNPAMVSDSLAAGRVKAEQSDIKLGLGLESQGSTSAAGQRAKPRAPTGTADHKGNVDKEESEETYLQQEGRIGRLLVYKSGKIKMQIGDIIMDVSQGSECSFLQEIVAVDSNDKQAFVMGGVSKRLVCVPNLTHLLCGLEAMDV
ncbi:hypothetical protein BGX34_010835 [Mortierella sp. NVP85]|nr:hypothetical protein BGX34_010835 [Mortierella sp. NVP85]